MKKNIIIFFAAIAGLSSCKKDVAGTASTTNSFKFTLSGENANFSGVVAVKDSSTTISLQTFRIQGGAVSGSNTNTFYLRVIKFGSGNFVGIHADDLIFPGDKILYVTVINGKNYSNKAYQSTSSSSALPANFTVTVTRDANKNVVGTFTGELYEINPLTNVAISTTKYNIANGSFDVNY